jgi:anti-anti-sigma factor
VQEPARLGPRYLRDFFGFWRRLPIALLAAWMQRPYLGESHVKTVATPQVMHVYVHGKLSTEIAPALQQAAAESIESGVVMVVNLNGVKQIDAAGLGALMCVRRTLLENGLTLSLAGLEFRHRFLLHAWLAHPLFDEWDATIANGRALGGDFAARNFETTARMDLHSEQTVLPAQTRARG